jgi:hypothetical protein
VVAKVSGILKKRKVENFLFKNNVLMVTCKKENRLFIMGFGVGMMKAVQKSAGSQQKASEIESTRELQDFDDYESPEGSPAQLVDTLEAFDDYEPDQTPRETYSTSNLHTSSLLMNKHSIGKSLLKESSHPKQGLSSYPKGGLTGQNQYAQGSNMKSPPDLLSYIPNQTNTGMIPYRRVENRLSSRFKENDPGNDTYRFKKFAKSESQNLRGGVKGKQKLISLLEVGNMGSVNGLFFEYNPQGETKEGKMIIYGSQGMAASKIQNGILADPQTFENFFVHRRALSSKLLVYFL